jgi:hypothetical protein
MNIVQNIEFKLQGRGFLPKHFMGTSGQMKTGIKFFCEKMTKIISVDHFRLN